MTDARMTGSRTTDARMTGTGVGTSAADARATGAGAGAGTGTGAAGAQATGTGAAGARGASTEADVRARVGAFLREVRRFARGIMGSDAYDKYLTHHRVTGRTHAPLSEREFWREKYAEEDRNPQGRCC